MGYEVIIPHWDNVRITRVVDGDTFEARAVKYAGFGATNMWDIMLRANRIDCHKAASPAGMSATSFARTKLEGRIVVVDIIDVYKYMPKRIDKEFAGAYMAEIHIDGHNYSDLAVTSGFADYWDGKGKGYGVY